MAKVNRSQDLTVEFRVTGPLSIFKGHAIVGRAKTDQTWMEFLVNTCQLPILRQGGFHIRTKTPTTATKWNGLCGGWTAELNEQIGKFVKRYERRRDQYTVVLIGGTRAQTKEVGGKAPRRNGRVSSGKVMGSGADLRRSPRGCSTVVEGDEETVRLGTMKRRRNERRIYHEGQRGENQVYGLDVAVEGDVEGAQLRIKHEEEDDCSSSGSEGIEIISEVF